MGVQWERSRQRWPHRSPACTSKPANRQRRWLKKSIAARLKQSGKGLVTLVVPVEAHKQDVEIVLPKRVQVTPELKSVIASLGGVVEVETV